MNAALEAAEKLERLSGLGATVSHAAGGVVINPNLPQPKYLIKITGGGTNGIYSFVEVVATSGQSFVEYTSGISGSTTSFPAKEINGLTTVSVNSIVEATLATTGDFVWFERGGGGSGGTELKWLTFTSDTDSTSDSDPGNGLFRWNNATQSSATQLFFDNQTADAISVTTFWGSLASTGYIYLQQADDSTKWQLWRWTATPVDGTGYRKFTVTVQAFGGSIADNKTVYCQFGVAGGAGTPGGAVTNIQYHDTGAVFGGDAGNVWDKTARTQTITKNANSRALIIVGNSTQDTPEIEVRTSAGADRIRIFGHAPAGSFAVTAGYFFDDVAPAGMFWTDQGGSLYTLQFGINNDVLGTRDTTRLGGFFQMQQQATGYWFAILRQGVGGAAFDWRYDFVIGSTGKVRFAPDSTDDSDTFTAAHDIRSESGATSSTIPTLALQARSTGTVAAGFGLDLRYQLESTTTNERDAARTDIVWVTETDASRKARVLEYVHDTAAREAIRYEATGTDSSVGRLLVGIGGEASTSRTFTVTQRNDAGTLLTGHTVFRRNKSAGTVADGFGLAIEFELESSTTPNQLVGLITVEWIVATHASRRARTDFWDDTGRAMRFENQSTNRQVAIGDIRLVPSNVQTYGVIAHKDAKTAYSTITNHTVFDQFSTDNTNIANGFGQRILFALATPLPDNGLSAASIQASWVTASHSTRAGRLAFFAFSTTTEQEAIRIDGNSGGVRIGVFGVTASARASAYTQTFSAADKTHAAFTASDIVDNTTGTANTTLEALPDPADTPASADALRDDLVANLIPALRNNYADLADQHNKLKADLDDLKRLCNSMIDDLQAYGWFQ